LWKAHDTQVKAFDDSASTDLEGEGSSSGTGGVEYFSVVKCTFIMDFHKVVWGYNLSAGAVGNCKGAVLEAEFGLGQGVGAETVGD
jgi:hypothetical protein